MLYWTPEAAEGRKEKEQEKPKGRRGTKSGKSCATNLLEFFEKAKREVDGGKPFDVIFLDFAKAFDKVPRRRLLAKLRAHGVTGKVLTWIKNWLTGRKQRVVLNGKHSTWADVLSGVPQGSVLGPLLFLIFINDLDKAATVIRALAKFADDTKLGHTVGTAKEREDLQCALDRLCEWADTWGMDFNVKKCKVLHLGHNNIRQKYTIKGEDLDETEEERDGDGGQHIETIGTMQKGSTDCAGGSEPDYKSLSLPRPTHLPEIIYPVCKATSRIFVTCMEPLVRYG